MSLLHAINPQKLNGATTPSERVSEPMSINATAAHKHDVTSGTTRITPSDAHKLLSCSRRRHALRVIVAHGEISKSDLIAKVGEREYGKPAGQMSSQERKRIHVSLHQCHLPKLENHDVINVDRHTITAGQNASRVLAYDHDSRSGIVTRVVNSVRS